MTLTNDRRWDETSDPNNPGWLVLAEIEPGRWEWMAPAPGHDLARDADPDHIDAMVAATKVYHGISDERRARHVAL